MAPALFMFGEKARSFDALTRVGGRALRAVGSGGNEWSRADKAGGEALGWEGGMPGMELEEKPLSYEADGTVRVRDIAKPGPVCDSSGRREERTHLVGFG